MVGPEDKDRSELGRMVKMSVLIIAATVAAAAASILLYAKGRHDAVDDILEGVNGACVSLYPPETDPAIDVVVNRTVSSMGYLEAIEAGPDGVLLRVPCRTRVSSPDPDLALIPNPVFSSGASGMTMECDTLGQGVVHESGLESGVDGDPDPSLAGWQVSSGGRPEASATLVAEKDAFKLEVTGRVGLDRVDAKVTCSSASEGGAFTCDVTDQGKTTTVPLDSSKGRALLGWVRDRVMERLGTMRNFGIPKSANAESSS